MKPYRPPVARCMAGIARRDITPPVGIFNRSWGAALHDTATGVHRPFTATALALQAVNGAGSPKVILALDLGWLEDAENEEMLNVIRAGAGDIDPSDLLISFSHSHAGCNLSMTLEGREGGHLLRPYLDKILGESVSAIEQAMGTMSDSWITFGSGHCDLAVNRDTWDEESGQFVCGYNPDGTPDDTLITARLTSDDGKVQAVIVNYGCHPTTMGPENRLLSPDYIGAMREVIESNFDVMSVFLLGACGDSSPREGYVADPGVADRNGRQLGFAAASVLESFPPAGTEYQYAGPIVSGATLGAWEHSPLDLENLGRSGVLKTVCLDLEIPIKESESVEELQRLFEEAESVLNEAKAGGDRLEIRDATAMHERARRKNIRGPYLPEGDFIPINLWVWQLGDAFIVAVPAEPYTVMQTELRSRFPDQLIIVSVVTNGTIAYLLPKDKYDTGLYQDWVSPSGPGCLEIVIEAAAKQIEEWI